MKRDMDLVRKILLAMEADDPGALSGVPTIDGDDPKTIGAPYLPNGASRLNYWRHGGSV
jgi:hypothetical protein